jgi:hypothetical protein
MSTPRSAAPDCTATISRNSTPRPNLQTPLSLIAPSGSCPTAGDLRRLLRQGVLSLIVLVASMAVSLSGVRAQDASRPLEFEVRPSGVERETPEDRLERRLKQREYLFRSICIHCGRGDRFGSNAPFNPYEALRKPVPE